MTRGAGTGPRRWHRAGALTEETLGQGFRAAAAAHSDHPAVVGQEGSLSYGDLDAVTDKVAAGLLDLGLKPRDRVIFQLTNRPETLVVFLACWKAGIIPICTLAAHREAEIGYLADFGGARAHFIESDAAKFDFLAVALPARLRTRVAAYAQANPKPEDF